MENTIRSQISKILLSLPESKLKPVLEYLKLVEKTSEKQLESAEFVKLIFEEDAELLKRLAE
jgi:hypothetical protein